MVIPIEHLPRAAIAAHALPEWLEDIQRMAACKR
jgi:hypothetical protein